MITFEGLVEEITDLKAELLAALEREEMWRTRAEQAQKRAGRRELDDRRTVDICSYGYENQAEGWYHTKDCPWKSIDRRRAPRRLWS